VVLGQLERSRGAYSPCSLPVGLAASATVPVRQRCKIAAPSVCSNYFLPVSSSLGYGLSLMPALGYTLALTVLN
jgi:hypothetical protein